MGRAAIIGWIGPLLVTSGLSATADRPLLGFSEEAAAAQLETEARFDALLQVDNLPAWMERMAARPHPVGSPQGKTNAHWMAERFEAWGFETRIEVFHVLFPTPRVRLLEMLRPEPFRASLVEPELAEDAASRLQGEHLPTYNAYSIDGDVTAPLVYVNYGLPQDYDELERRGIDVSGMLVIARYGGAWRGIKPKVAAEHGAVGCLIYSDPRDDGFYQGDVYPQGAFRSEHGVQRGSVVDMPLYPGDPLTPGVGATRNAERLDRAEARTLTSIPVLPISYADARPLLEALGGPVAPPAWRGALPITYHLGPGPAEVRLKVEFDWETVPAYDVIALLRGSESPDQWILRGNHHDAWVHGADDPVSGLVALMEEARAVGELARSGRAPRRTIVYAAWDAEEPGLLGSTEWVETHAAVLRDRAVAYINSDSIGRGFLGAGGSHTLERFFNEVARDVTDPQTGLSVAERARSRLLVGGSAEDRRDAWERESLRLSALGSGSDFTPFLQHLGVASLNLGYGGEDSGGAYHSIYDSFDHYKRFGDPGFAYGITLARTAGRAVLRLASAEILPFEFGSLAETVGGYADELSKLLDEMRERTVRENRLIREGRYVAAADPTRTYVPPEPEEPVPHINLAPLDNALTRLALSAERYGAALGSAELDGLTVEQRRDLNLMLFHSERALTRDEGLPDRPWYKHHVYAPGYYTGYGVKTLPAVREAIEQRDWELAEAQVRITAQVLDAFAGQVDAAAEILEGAAQPEETVPGERR